MKKLIRGLVVAALLLSWSGTALTAAFAVNLRDALTSYRQKNLRENLSLRARLSQIEDVLESGADRLLGEKTDPDGGAVAADAPAETLPVAGDTESSQPDVTCTDEITHPGAHAAEEPTAGESGQTGHYRISEYRGIIGVFDGDGVLIRTVNVRVDTLPAVDQEALAAGIPADTWQDMMDIVDAYV